MGLMKPPKEKEIVTDVLITHVLNEGGYLSVTQNTPFEDILRMLKDKTVPNILLDLTDEETNRHFIKVSDVSYNSTQDTIYMFVVTKGYKLEFYIKDDGTYNRSLKE